MEEAVRVPHQPTEFVVARSRSYGQPGFVLLGRFEGFVRLLQQEREGLVVDELPTQSTEDETVQLISP